MTISHVDLPNPAMNTPSAEAAVVQEYQNKIWSKRIPITNRFFMVTSLLFVFGLDLLILINSFDLLAFWIEMLIMLGVFSLFYFLENHYFNNKFVRSKSSLDPWIFLAVFIRNFVILGNFIPLIQLVGIFFVTLLGAPYLIAYVILIYFRNKNVSMQV